MHVVSQKRVQKMSSLNAKLVRRPHQRVSIWKRCRERWQLFLFILPPLVFLAIFEYYPMFGVQIAFKNYSPGLGIWNSPWVGFDNFTRFFSSFQFSRVVTNTLRISLYSLVVGFPLSFIFALMLNIVRSPKIKKTVQTITYVPYFISVVVVVGLLNQVFNPVVGLYGNIYRLFNPGGYPDSILTKPQAFIHLYVWSGVWQGMGWSSIIYLAALSNVDPELQEAAQIDGANRFQRVLHIDLPTILPTASIMLILNSGSLMSVGFEKIYLMQNNMNLQFSEVISTYVYKVGMTGGGGANFSYASAIGLFNSVINCALLVIVNLIARRLGDGEGASLW